MRILLWHGYLLRGSGSNIYTANVAKVWRRQGHDVVLMCQERHPEALDFVDRYGECDDDNLDVRLVARDTAAAAGSCDVVRPNIGRILPVYVYDEYEGFEAKRFVDLDEGELQAYIDRNIAAMEMVIARYQPEAIITGHEVMGPFVAAQACASTGTRYIAKLHGSALEYAVKVQDRYKGYAAQGLGGAHRVVGGSRYMVGEAARHIPGWRNRAVVVNPGCDIDLFIPDPARRNVPPNVGYVGKFIVMKGVQNFLAALPATNTELRAVIVGYGGFDEQLQTIARALRSGDLEMLVDIARTESLGDVETFLDALDDPEKYRAKARSIEIEFTGRLEHGPLARVLPTWDLLVVPSILAEAFGMVAAEAAACAVLPIVPRHSGIGEVGSALEEALGTPGLLTYDPSAPVDGIASRIDDLLALTDADRAELATTAAEVARGRWSWERVANDLLALATSH